MRIWFFWIKIFFKLGNNKDCSEKTLSTFIHILLDIKYFTREKFIIEIVIPKSLVINYKNENFAKRWNLEKGASN